MDSWIWWLLVAVGLGIPLVITTMPELAMFAVGALFAMRRHAAWAPTWCGRC